MPAHPAARRTRATSSPFGATSPTTAASSASTVGTSSSCCRRAIWSQVWPGASRVPARQGGTRGGSGAGPVGEAPPLRASRLAVRLHRGPLRTLPGRPRAAGSGAGLLPAGAEGGPAQGAAGAGRQGAGGEEGRRGGRRRRRKGLRWPRAVRPACRLSQRLPLLPGAVSSPWAGLRCVPLACPWWYLARCCPRRCSIKALDSPDSWWCAHCSCSACSPRRGRAGRAARVSGQASGRLGGTRSPVRPGPRPTPEPGTQ